MDRSDVVPSFWKCSRCGTHNPVVPYLTTCLGCGGVKQNVNVAERTADAQSKRASIRTRFATIARSFKPRSPAGFRSYVVLIAWAYVVLLVVLWISLRSLGDYYWPVTLLLYAPRWPFVVPVAFLVPVAAVWRRRALIPALVSLVLIFGPIMGLCIPWNRKAAGRDPSSQFRIVTCNLESGHWNPDDLRVLVESLDPDILVCQEWSDPPGAPAEWSKKRYVRRDGGLYLSSRYPIRASETLINPATPWRTLAARYELQTPSGILYLVNLHQETPRKGIEALKIDGIGGLEEFRRNIELRRSESAALTTWTQQLHGAVMLAGDFNMPSDSSIYRRYWSTYRDAFADAGWGYGYTKFTKWHGIRIDHVLTGSEIRCARSWVGPDVGSDHRPLIADLLWKSAAKND